MSKVTHKNERQCFALLGRQAVGKSSLMLELATEYARKGGKVRIYSPHPAQFGGFGVLCNRENIGEILEELLAGKFKGFVIFDDADTYMGPSSSDGMTAFCSTFRHFDCDIAVSSRAPQQIDIALRRCFTKVCLFKMHEPRAIKCTRELLGEFEEKQFKVPREKHEYYVYDLEDYTVEFHKTKRMTT